MAVTLAALAVAVPVLTLLRIAGMGMCVYGHDSDRVRPANQSRKGERMTLLAMPVIKRGKVQW